MSIQTTATRRCSCMQDTARILPINARAVPIYQTSSYFLTMQNTEPIFRTERIW